MPIYINNALLDSSHSLSPVDVFKEHPQLCEDSKLYRKNLQKIKINKNDRVLFVHQREIVTIAPHLNKQNFTHVCTDDATTCHNVVLIEKTTRTISLGHFDGCSTHSGLETMFSEMNNIISLAGADISSIQYDLYLFGGFIDDKKYSEILFTELINYCAQSPFNVHLKIACCYSMNDIIVNSNHLPDIYGVAIHINNHNITIATCLERGPDHMLRYARMSCIDTFSPIYDYRKQTVYVDPFRLHKMKYTNEMLQLDDEMYLKFGSTSPHCEPVGFVQQSRQCLLFRVKWEKHVNKIFQGKRREYVFVNNKWNLLDEQQLSLPDQ